MNSAKTKTRHRPFPIEPASGRSEFIAKDPTLHV